MPYTLGKVVSGNVYASVKQENHKSRNGHNVCKKLPNSSYDVESISQDFSDVIIHLTNDEGKHSPNQTAI